MTCLFYFWKPFLLARNKILFNQALTDFGLKILSGIILNTGPISAVKLSVFTLGRTITFVFGSITLLIPPPPPVSEGLSHWRMSLLALCGWIMKCCLGCVCYHQLPLAHCEMALKMQLVNDVKRWHSYCCQTIVIKATINFDYIYNIINNHYLGEGHSKFCLKLVPKPFLINI